MQIKSKAVELDLGSQDSDLDDWKDRDIDKRNNKIVRHSNTAGVQE